MNSNNYTLINKESLLTVVVIHQILTLRVKKRYLEDIVKYPKVQLLYFFVFIPTTRYSKYFRKTIYFTNFGNKILLF